MSTSKCVMSLQGHRAPGQSAPFTTDAIGYKLCNWGGGDRGRRRLGEPLTLQFPPLETAGWSREEGGAAVGTSQLCFLQGQHVSCSRSESLLGCSLQLGEGRRAEQGEGARARELLRVSHPPPGFLRWPLASLSTPPHQVDTLRRLVRGRALCAW